MITVKEEFIEARNKIYDEVKKELLGPGSEDIGGDIEYELITDDPISRYSLGILFPKECINEQDIDSRLDIEINVDSREDLDELIDYDKKSYKIDNNTKNKSNDSEIDEKISMANELKPSSMGLTFFAKGNIDELYIRVKAAKYRESIVKDCCVKYEGEDYFKETELREYIYRENEYLKLRKPLGYDVIKRCRNNEDKSVDYTNFINVVYALSRQCKIKPNSKGGFVREPLPLQDTIKVKLNKNYNVLNLKNKFTARWNIKMEYDLQICVYLREYKNNIKSYTVILCNNEEYIKYGRDEKSIFQPEIIISTEDNPNLVFVENRDDNIIDIDLELDEEEKSLDLLYRNKKNYAIGHGVATLQNIDIKTGLGEIKTSFMPYYEVRGINFDLEGISNDESNSILSMKNLSDYSELSKGEIINNLNKILTLYNNWIENLEKEAIQLEKVLKSTALKHIRECKVCSDRIKKGINLLDKNDSVFLAFKLMNRALFMQRCQSNLVESYKERFPDEKEIPLVNIDFKNEDYKKGIWRAFQIAYILMCLESIVNPESNERDIIDLIWVPTGGGKTEAYLGLTAFTIFLRRIKNKNDNGTAVIMRYTLRLLAAQQFTRASTLICACELIRRENENLLGKEKISIGIWIGGTQTPNTKQDAAKKYQELTKNSNYKKENVFQVLKCPWCGTKLEKIKKSGKEIGKWGYYFTSKEHDIFCTDDKCPFNEKLPIEVVDEFIYKNPTTLLFGTVDKFATITWKGETRNLFALNSGNMNKSPELIIQDELHLISGPLGSMVGQYETVVDLLCSEKGIKPKIIASTATIRRAKEQCNQLYVREVNQFPPSGLLEDDSFFTRTERDEDKPGRLYVGLMPSGKTLTTTQIRLMSALINRLNMLDIKDEVKSQYWTLVGYFNTLKELGMTRSLIGADIQQNIDIVSKRLLNKKYPRKLYDSNIAELTSRKSSTEINNTLKNLEIGLCDKDKEKKIYPIDVLLSSNMISVGVDISRLNVMMVFQQPKLTSEYIQATSRVGRKYPGIIFTLYNPSRSRDRSHYELFYDYHQSFYKYVEPTSVTSFSDEAIKRMLQSVFIALVRHIVGLNDNKSAKDFTLNNKEMHIQIEHILGRAKKILEGENESLETIEKEIEYIKSYLYEIGDLWERKIDKYGELYYTAKKGKQSLLKSFNEVNYDEVDIKIMNSMRNVDSQGKVDIIYF